MLLPVWVNIVFDLGQQELSDPEEPSPRRNLVAVGFANAGRRKRHRTLVVVEELLEIEKLSLGSFGTKIDRRSRTWSNGRLEHQVERNRWEDFVVVFWIPDVVMLDQLRQPVAVVVVDLNKELWLALHVMYGARIIDITLARIPLYSSTVAWSSFGESLTRPRVPRTRRALRTFSTR